MLAPKRSSFLGKNMAETSIDTGTTQLLCSIRDSVAVITLNRPEARNAYSPEIRQALPAMIERCLDDPEVGALMITGAGTAFCAGGDVKGMGDRRQEAPQTPEEKLSSTRARHRRMTGRLATAAKPTIAALPGPAAGAGLALALCCDIRIAAQSAFLSTGYARVGLSGDYGIAWLMMRAVGEARARELLLTCERIDIARAERIGLVNRVVPDADLQDKAFELARSLANGPRIALRRIKENIEAARNRDYLEALDFEAKNVIETGQTADHKEAVRAFVEKRAPVFRDR
jgi:enoyl-CoA hydratase/carnithine racemase